MTWAVPLRAICERLGSQRETTAMDEKHAYPLMLSSHSSMRPLS